MRDMALTRVLLRREAGAPMKNTMSLTKDTSGKVKFLDNDGKKIQGYLQSKRGTNLRRHLKHTEHAKDHAQRHDINVMARWAC